MNHRTESIIQPMIRAGIAHEDALALRRISMTLHRWHELECGDGNEWNSWAIERENEDGTGRPFMVTYPHRTGNPRRHLIPDRESGALRRLRKIMARYPSLGFYVQGDPRGAALYILRPGDVPEGADADAYYSRGVAVYR